MPKHTAGGYLDAGNLARQDPGPLLAATVRALRRRRHAALGDGVRGRYLGDGDVVVLLVDQGAAGATLERCLEALGVTRA